MRERDGLIRVGRMAPPLACTYEIYATRIASERVRTCSKRERTNDERGEEEISLSLPHSLEPLNSFNFAASAKVIASDCLELTNHKSSEALWL